METLKTRLLRLISGRAPADALQEELLLQAEALILNYTGRLYMPEALRAAQVQLAVILYNRLGTEGESSRQEGGMRLQFREFPLPIRCQLQRFRLCRVPGGEGA